MISRKTSKLRTCIEEDFNDFEFFKKKKASNHLPIISNFLNKPVNSGRFHSSFEGLVPLNVPALKRSTDIDLFISEEEPFKMPSKFSEADLMEMSEDIVEDWIKKSCFLESRDTI